MSKPLRVLSISTLFPCPARPGFGGFVASQMQAVAALAAAGEAVELTMVNPIGLPPWPLRARAPYRNFVATPAVTKLGGLEVHHPRFLTLPGLPESNPARVVRAILPLVRRLHAEAPFDLIDAQFTFPDAPAAHAIALALGLPLTTKARGSDVIYWGRRASAHRQILAAGRYAARQLTVSESLRREMVAIGLPDDTIRVHYTGLDHAKFFPRPRGAARVAMAPFGVLDDDAPLLACPGALVPVKGQDLAIHALAALPGIHLALAGTGPEEARLRALATELGLSARVHFLGQLSHEHLPVLLAAADALVLPSSREGLANVWIEALACGTPLVIPDVGGAREVVQAASAGQIVPREPAAIAAAVTALLASPPAPEEVAAHAARFDWQNNARELVAHWREAAEV